MIHARDAGRRGAMDAPIASPMFRPAMTGRCAIAARPEVCADERAGAIHGEPDCGGEGAH